MPPGLLRLARKKLWLSALLLTANVLLYLVLITPARQQQAELTAKVNLVDSARPDQVTAATDTVSGQFAVNNRELDDFYGHLLPREDFDRFLGELFDFSTQAGLLLDRISFQPNSHNSQRILEYRVRFNVSGSYDQIRKFVHLLENSPRLIAIRTLSLSGKAKTASRISVGMEIDTFFQLEAT